MIEKNDTTTNDIDALRFYLNAIGCSETHLYRRALTALVAERDTLKQRVAELEAAAKPRYIVGGATIESIDLRERLVCAALTGASTQEGWRSRDAMAGEVVANADAVLAVMRKEGGA